MLTQALRPTDGWAARRNVAVVAGVAVAALAVSTVFHPGAGEYFTGSDNPGSVAAANRVGEFLADNTRAATRCSRSGRSPPVSVSGRDNVPGVSVGLFSYEDLTTPDALDLHYVNAELLRRTLRTGQPAAVVITGVDETIFHFTGTFSRTPQDPGKVLDALVPRYRLAKTDVGWGADGPVRVRIYLRTDRP